MNGYRYDGFEASSCVLIAISAAAVFAFLIKPHILTALISIFGLLAWLAIGLVIEGIGC